MTQPYPHRFPGITFAALAAELAREAQARITTHARELARGRMAPADVAREAALVAAWQEDCRRMAALQPGQNPNYISPSTCDGEVAGRRPDGGATPPRHGLSWRARVQGLTRELDLRARHYPAWIEQGRMTAAQSAHQTGCLQVVQAFYLDGLDWPGGEDLFESRVLFCIGVALRSPPGLELDKLAPGNPYIAAYAAAIERGYTPAACGHPPQQPELAL